MEEVQSPRHAAWLDWAAVSVFFIACTAIWRGLNHGPPQWDDSWYLCDSLALIDALHKWGLGGWLRCYIFEVQVRFRAPLMCALPTPIYLLFGRHISLAYWIIYLFILLLLAGVHSVARHFWGRRVALLAVFITGSLTELFTLTTWYLVEYGLAAMVVAAIWCLIRSQDLKRTRWVAAFSILSGLGLLQKIVFPVYVGPLFVWCLVRRLKSRGQTDSPGWAATLAALVIPAALIAGPWYVMNFGIVVHHAWVSGFSQQEADLYSTGNPFTAAAMGKYLIMVVNEGIGAPYFIAGLIAALVWLMVRPFRRRPPSRGEAGGNMLLFLWALPFLVFFFGHNKQVRFIAPILPIFAIVLAILLSQIIDTLGNWGWGLTAVLLVGALGMMVQLCFQPLGPRKLVFFADPTRPNDDTAGLHFFDDGMAFTRMFEPNYWPLLQTLEESIALAPAKGTYVYHVMTANDSLHFNLNNLQLAAMQARLPVQVLTTAYYSDPDQLRADIRKMDFFLFRVNAENSDTKYNRFEATALDEVKNDGLFEAVRSDLQFPDSGVLWIYRNRTAGAK